MVNSKKCGSHPHHDQQLISEATYRLVTPHKEKICVCHLQGPLQLESEKGTGKKETTTAF